MAPVAVVELEFFLIKNATLNSRSVSSSFVLIVLKFLKLKYHVNYTVLEFLKLEYSVSTYPS